MQTSLERIADKAKRQKDYRFQNLYRILNEELLLDSWGKLNKDAATGIDGISYQEYGKNLTENIRGLVERLKRKSYHAKLVRRHYIPKGNGKMRPLGIPAIEDKLVQHAAAQILQAIYEQDFLSCSYAYRPTIGAHEAVNKLQTTLYHGRYRFVVEADIRGFFDNMDHEWMVRMLEQRIDDGAMIWLIRKWLKAGVMETDGKVIHPATGTPQGGIISPILANIYMHYALNLWFEKIVKRHCKGAATIFVYADDFVAAFEYEEDARRYYNVLGKRLGKFGLELSSDKTRIVRFSRCDKKGSGAFEFLGFEYRWLKSRTGKDWLKRSTARKKLINSIKNFQKWCKENRHIPLKRFFSKLNSKLRGYVNYYGVIGNLDRLEKFFYGMRRILFKWLNRRSERASYNWKGFSQMLCHFGVVKPKITDRTTELARYEARS